MRWIASLAAAAGLAAAAFAQAGGGRTDSILRLLNSRSSGSKAGYAEAAEEVAKLAKAGNKVHRYVLALVSREPDAPEAARLTDAEREEYFGSGRGYLRRFAEKNGNTMALYLLSLETGDADMLKKAADGGNVQALNAWGTRLFQRVMSGAEGEGTEAAERTLKEAYGYFRRAAAEGDANGLYNVGMCEWRGLGTARNPEAALSSFMSAAEKNHPEAINNVGAFLRSGECVERDAALAAQWFRKSAGYGNAFGQFNYAMALKLGEGVPKDAAAAAELLKKAAEGDCVEALNVLGVAYLKGDGVEKDEKKAFGLFAGAAAAGYPPAMENLSACYANGTGAEADERLSLEWKIRSRAARGDRAAREWLGRNSGDGEK